jgi:hypothetical protein
MNCKDVRENLIELLAQSEGQADPALAAHVKECAGCAGELESLRKTSALLDEWEAPEPSPYFLTRLSAHVREEQSKQPESWFVWLRKPWLSAAFAAVLVIGSGVYLAVRGPGDSRDPVVTAGSAVNDLDSLDRNHDLYVNTDLLDELSGAASEDVVD